MNLEEFDFSNLEPQEFPVKLPNDTAQYILRECSEGDATRFRRENLKALKDNGTGGVVMTEAGADLEPLLLTMCLWRVKDDSKPHPEGRERVNFTFVNNLNPIIASRLYQKAREISGINADELTEELVEKKIASLQQLLDRMKKMKGEGQAGKAP